MENYCIEVILENHYIKVSLSKLMTFLIFSNLEKPFGWNFMRIIHPEKVLVQVTYICVITCYLRWRLRKLLKVCVNIDLSLRWAPHVRIRRPFQEIFNTRVAKPCDGVWCVFLFLRFYNFIKEILRMYILFFKKLRPLFL